MEFKRGLHPFYPPAIRLLRPRCAAPLLGALSSHPMLRLRNWDPWRPQRDLIQQLRLFLQVWLPTGCPLAPLCLPATLLTRDVAEFSQHKPAADSSYDGDCINDERP